MLDWARKHLILALLIGVVAAPTMTLLVLWGLVGIVVQFAPVVADFMIPTAFPLCIGSIVTVIRWYRQEKKKADKTEELIRKSLER